MKTPLVLVLYLADGRWRLRYWSRSGPDLCSSTSLPQMVEAARREMQRTGASLSTHSTDRGFGRGYGLAKLAS